MRANFNKKVNILLFTKSLEIKGAIRKGFDNAEGFNIVYVHDYDSFNSLIKTNFFEIVIIDYLVSNRNTLNDCVNILHSAQAEFCILADPNFTIDKQIAALKLGLTNYLTTPFDPEFIRLKIERLVGRGDEGISFGKGLSIDPYEHALEIYGKKILFTRTEFEILHFLVKQNRCTPSHSIIEHLSKDEYDLINETSLRVYIKRIRDKVKGASGYNLIKNRHGIGYYIGLQN